MVPGNVNGETVHERQPAVGVRPEPVPARPGFERIGGLRYAIDHPHELVKHLRTRSGPVRLVQRIFARAGLPVSANDRALLALRHRHQGRRCFVVGNGPSLRLSDLEAIRSEISIASNRIFVAFDEVEWRPTYYTVTDPLYADVDRTSIAALDLQKVFPDYMRRILQHGGSERQGSTVYYRPLRGRFTARGEYLGRFSADALLGFHPGRSVTVLNIQLAHYLGCDPIYLIGVDGRYELSTEGAEHRDYGQVLVNRGERSHFHPDYRQPGEFYQPPAPDLVEAGLGACRHFLDSHGTTLRNASRSTQVQAIETADLDEVLSRGA